MAKKRLDQILVEIGFAPSRTKAKELITSGNVEITKDGQTKIMFDPSYPVTRKDLPEIRLLEDRLLKYVSRAGLKLEGALIKTKFDVKGLMCLDAGQSTGGFTQVLIERGASQVIGFDVGHDQLHEKIKTMGGVKSFEGINAKESDQHPSLKDFLNQIDLVVGDISFISSRLYLSKLSQFLKADGHLILLIKPQFELTRAHLNKKGVVSDREDYDVVEDAVATSIEGAGLKLVDYFESCIVGQDGNREFFVHAKK